MDRLLLRISAITTLITILATVGLLATGGTYTALVCGVFAIFVGMFYLGEVERHSVDIHSTYW
jgi:hypothetical protein